MTPVAGDPVEIAQVAAKYLAGAGQFKTAHDKVKSIHDNVFPAWEGAASREGERATTMAVGRAKYALDALTGSGHALGVFGNELASAKAAQQAAAAEITTKQAAVVAGNQGAVADVKSAEKKALTAHGDANAARRKVESALIHSSTTQWYTVPAYTARFDPVTAAIIDSLVAHHWMSRGAAQAVAGRLGKLSAADYKKFAKLEAAATTDKQRGDLFSAVAAGKPLPKLNTTAAPGISLAAPLGAVAFTGTASWFNDSTTATGISASSHFGVSVRRPGTTYGAAVNESSKLGYWKVTMPDGKSMVLQQIDIGPNQSVGNSRTIDLSAPAAKALNLGGLQSGVHATFLGHDPKWASYYGKVF
jgi:hypothetical protein